MANGEKKECSCAGAQVNFDALPPKVMAEKAETVGIAKVKYGWRNTFMLSILAGAFIALGAIFCTTVVTGASGVLPFGVTKLLGGAVFCLGLILVVVAGAELFTGNNLIIMATVSGRVTFGQLLWNWALVWFGNLVGSLLTVIWMFLAGQYMFGNGAIGLTALAIANAKCSLGFVQAVCLGIGCNALVCLAVWLCFGAHSTTDKILAILFPITCFVAAGFEHCIANMYFIPIGLFIKAWAPAVFWTMTAKTGASFPMLTWGNFIWANLLPVTIGNIIGGAGFVGFVYWFVYRRAARKPIFEN